MKRKLRFVLIPLLAMTMVLCFKNDVHAFRTNTAVDAVLTVYSDFECPTGIITENDNTHEVHDGWSPCARSVKESNAYGNGWTADEQYITEGGWNWNGSTYEKQIYIHAYCERDTPYLLLYVYDNKIGATPIEELQFLSGGIGNSFEKPSVDIYTGSYMRVELGANFTEGTTVRINWVPDEYYVCYYQDEDLTRPFYFQGENVWYRLYAYNDTFSLREDVPSKTGNTFKCWHRIDNRTVDTGLTYGKGSGGHRRWIAGSGIYGTDSYREMNAYLYPEWTVNKYTVKYELNGGTSAQPADQLCEYDKTYNIAKDPTWRGHTFLGWKLLTATGGTYGANTNKKTFTKLSSIDGGVVRFQAQWEANEVSVIYDKNLGNGTAKDSYTKKYTYGEKVALETAPTRSGYKFLGWQVYSGSDTKKNSTVTNNNGTGNVLFKSGEVLSSFDLAGEGTVKLVAIWEHKHEYNITPEVNVTKTSDMHVSNTSPLTTGKGYYVSTASKARDITGTWKTTISGESYMKNTATLETTKKSGNASLSVSDNTFTATVKGDSGIALSPTSVVTCEWFDNYNQKGSCNYSKTHNTLKSTIIGDNASPDISGIDAVKKITGIDLSDVSSYMVSLSASEKGTFNSGINKAKSYAKIINKDNGKTYTLNFTDDGKVEILGITFESFDVTKRNTFVKNLFNGDFDVAYYLVDNVGNVNSNIEEMGVFDMSISLKSQTYDPSNYNDAGVLLMKKGEAGRLNVKTFGYAKALKLEFPSDWYISEEYPLYMYWGSASDYDASKLEKITSPVFYINVESAPDGTWEHDFIFISPLNANEGTKNIKVTAYKGDVAVVGNSSIRINEHAGTNVIELSRQTQFVIDKKNLIEDLRTAIYKTYRGK